MGHRRTRSDCPGQQSFLNTNIGVFGAAGNGIATATQPRTNPAATEISAPRFSTQKGQEPGYFAKTFGKISGRADRYEEQLLQAAKDLRAANAKLLELETVLNDCDAGEAKLAARVEALGAPAARVDTAGLKAQIEILETKVNALNDEIYGPSSGDAWGKDQSEENMARDKALTDERNGLEAQLEQLKANLSKTDKSNAASAAIASERAALGEILKKQEAAKSEYAKNQDEADRLSNVLLDLFDKLRQVADEDRCQKVKTKVNEIIKGPAPRKRSGITELLN